MEFISTRENTFVIPAKAGIQVKRCIGDKICKALKGAFGYGFPIGVGNDKCKMVGSDKHKAFGRCLAHCLYSHKQSKLCGYITHNYLKVQFILVEYY